MDTTTSSASESIGSYPRPQLRRPLWHSLDGEWRFAYDDSEIGTSEKWFRQGDFPQTIVVPYPPESPASGIGDPSYHPVVWYARTLTADETARDDDAARVVLHFGAVDYAATVWVNGSQVATHAGGHSPFSADITDYLDGGDDLLVVRAVDRPLDVGQPRGKQEWLPEPHEIWYRRTTGIWQPVWLEQVAPTHITELSWRVTRGTDSVELEVLANRPLTAGATVDVELSYDGEPLARVSSVVTSAGAPLIVIPLRDQRNGQHYEKLTWSPENPRLIDATVTVTDGDSVDTVESYLGLRTVGTAAGRFLLNDRPYFVRAVLEQGYWPESHLAAPSADALRAEVQLIKDMGFNTARIHQKAEDPRFLYWADRLGLLLWGEAPAAYEFTTNAIADLTREWLELVRRDRSHPSVVTWVPFNESWGLRDILTDAPQRAFSRGLADLTRALDPTRPVISNDGWEHTHSDILTVHDYDGDPETFARRYADHDALKTLFSGYGPSHRMLMAEGEADTAALPVMVSEFGGVKYESAPSEPAWGYTTSTTVEELESHLRGIFGALLQSRVLSGFCYTQITDTMQEANGLADENRVPKLPLDVIRSIVAAESHSTP
ncbi:glycoside hydrolase family 2 protein [Microbacterium sp. W4I20]|uniref:glycoside hydrolase family 2 protein n=1 Tax=Microbacterium sp. W4I20 TaxID=3042262 RepID=UPI00278A81E8|nr:sugar-binding domain-containing protein [Microbacterium sp. W4I20]MDQ0726643.1 beta-galactosidase/beta-glucuronidase [Microbacterium sp. W4I20]